MNLSVNKEKAIVLLGTLGAAISGYLIGIGRPLEGGLLGSIVAAVAAFWSEGINTKQES